MTTTRRVENYGGLRREPQLEEIVNFLSYHQETTKFPDREAKQIRNHPFLTQLDFFDTNEDQKRAWEEEKRKEEVKEIAVQIKSSEALERAKRSRSDTAVVDPMVGGRGPNKEILVGGKSRQQTREEYDEKLREMRDNPRKYVELDDESRIFENTNQGKSDLMTQTVRFSLRKQASQPKCRRDKFELASKERSANSRLSTSASNKPDIRTRCKNSPSPPAP